MLDPSPHSQHGATTPTHRHGGRGSASQSPLARSVSASAAASPFASFAAAPLLPPAAPLTAAHSSSSSSSALRFARLPYSEDSGEQHVHLQIASAQTTAAAALSAFSPPAAAAFAFASPSPKFVLPSAAPFIGVMPAILSSSSVSSLRQRGGGALDTSLASGGRAQLKAFKAELKAARRRVRLLTAPVLTLSIFAEIVLEYVHTTAAYLLSHRLLLYGLLSSSLALLLLYAAPGAHQQQLAAVSSLLSFSLFWSTLGVLSSVGLGTGLHTFVLYLGPFIAKTTLAVTECNTIDIKLDGPDAFLCPTRGLSLHSLAPVTFLGLLAKVAPAALLWGAGTAIGELPPYFVSRAATLSGQKLAELDALEEIDEAASAPPSPLSPPASALSSASPRPRSRRAAPRLSLADRAKLLIYHALERYGFWAIVLFASIPNPLFDLAGLACGHFLIPFWTFFGATVIGKAVVKAQLQTALVIVAFNRERLEGVVRVLEERVSPLRGKLGPFFERQRSQFHLQGGADAAGAGTTAAEAGRQTNWLSLVWNVFLVSMILWFVLSIVDSSVQERLATRDQARIEKFAQDKGLGSRADKDDQ